MNASKQDLEREFVCPKCRNRGAVVQDVQLGRAVARMLAIFPTRYRAASCALCGYTELYNLAIVEKCEEEALQTAPKLAEKPES